MENINSRAVHQFITAFRDRDPSLIPDLVGERCVMEGMQPAPDGLRVEGYLDNVRFWQAMVLDTRGTFETGGSRDPRGSRHQSLALSVR